jgi:hypothetical protein
MTKFEALKRKLKAKGAKNPYALATWIEERKGGEAQLERAKETEATEAEGERE